MTEIELPAVPYLTDAICKAPWTVDDIVRSYGKACARAALERAAQIAGKFAKRDFPWGSENSDRYHAQADWAELVAAAIRAEIERD